MPKTTKDIQNWTISKHDERWWSEEEIDKLIETFINAGKGCEMG